MLAPRRWLYLAGALAIVFFTECSPRSVAQCLVHEFVPADGGVQDWYGESLDIDGERIAVGGWLNDELARNSGAIYIYERSAGRWNLAEKLLRLDGGEADGFGYPLLLRGATLVVGIVGESVAEVYENQEGVWTRNASLVGHDVQSLDHYGNAVALHGRTLLVGSYGASAVYVFEQDDGGAWHETAKLVPWDMYGGYFGWSLAIEGDVIAVGAPDDSQAINYAGAVYIFERSPEGIWQRKTKLIEEHPVSLGSFGAALAISQGRLLVGATYELWIEDSQAYIYEKDANGDWFVTARLQPPMPMDVLPGFGAAVDLQGDRAVVGAPIADGVNGRSFVGTAYVFERQPDGSWLRLMTLTPDDGREHDYFGSSVSLDGNYVLAGAYQHDQIATDCGAAYLYNLELDPPDSDCNANGTPDECEPDCNENGIPDDCDLDPGDPDGDGFVSPDCNENGAPDECEPDCNENGIPDDCDLDPGDPDDNGHISPDCNANATPDECDLDPSDPDGDGAVSRDVNGNQTPDECEPLTTLTRIDAPPTSGADLASFQRNVTHYTFDLVVDTRLRAGDWLRCELNADVFGDVDGDGTIDGRFWHASDQSDFGPPLGNLMVPYVDAASTDTRAFDTFVSVPGLDFFLPALLDAPGGAISTDTQLAGRDATGTVIPLRWYDVVSRPAGERFAALRVTVAVDPARVHGLIALDDHAAARGSASDRRAASDGAVRCGRPDRGDATVRASPTRDEPPPGSVAFATLAGAAVHAAGPAEPFAFTLYATPPACPADLNGDRAIDLADLNLLLQHFGQHDLPADPACPGDSPTRCAGDLDGDRDVDLLDLSALLIAFGGECP